MCGIVGCQLKRPLTDADIKQMQSLRDSLTHRGPDEKGEYIKTKDGLYLGHRRLSIIDLDPRSAQPMQSERQILTYNGEIYNYLELRQELENEYVFKTNSDTEVLLHAWDKWDAEALLKLDGMFAFALRDNNGLHLVTDFFGEKPLYVFENKDGFYFSSEAGPLIHAFNPKWAPSEQDLSQFMHLGYIEPPQTGYQGLISLPAGTHITIKPDHSVIKDRYWQPQTPFIPKGRIKPITPKDINDLKDFLCISLQKRLRSDVKIGLFLSGGVDSTLVAALASKELGADLHSYTVAFPDGADEAPYATRIAAHLGVSHTIIETESDESWRKAPQELLDLYGVPNDNMTALAVRSMCAEAKKYLTVALTGLGGDELFYGYNKYETFYKRRWAYNLPTALHKALTVLPIKKAKTASSLLKGDDMRRFLRVKNGQSQEIIEQMNIAPLHNMLEPLIEGLTHQARFFDLISTMPQSYIPAIDRGSMREGIEVRTPFLNKDLLNFVMQLDQRALIDTEKKYMLRRLLAHYIDLDLLTPNKQGFVYPIARYFKQKNVNFACDNTLCENHERLALRQCLLAEIAS